jgi:ABC-2 type transport system ATP-binding protein
MTETVRISDVHKQFEGTKAVDGISFALQPGEIFGLLGPNGAGKTTLIRMILGIFQPDQGAIEFSFAEKGGAFRDKVGYLPEERGLYDDRKISDTLIYLAELKNIEGARARERALRWLDRLELGRYYDRRVRELSKGMQQKIQFIASVLHEPPFVVLDEPFAGLDPVNQDLFRDLIRELRSSGRTVLLSSHQMNFVEDLCDRILLVNRGRAVVYGPLREVKKSYGRDHVYIEFQGDAGFLQHDERVRECRLSDRQAELVLGPQVHVNEFLQTLVDRLQIEQISIEKSPLHEIFVNLVKPEGTSRS